MAYWAVKPKSMGPEFSRIEKADSSYEACCLAFGRPVVNLAAWHAKNMGTRVSVIQSDKKRVALLTDPANWVDLTR